MELGSHYLKKNKQLLGIQKQGIPPWCKQQCLVNYTPPRNARYINYDSISGEIRRKKKKKSRKFLILKVEGIKIQKMLARKRVGGFHCSRGNGN